MAPPSYATLDNQYTRSNQYVGTLSYQRNTTARTAPSFVVPLLNPLPFAAQHVGA